EGGRRREAGTERNTTRGLIERIKNPDPPQKAQRRTQKTQSRWKGESGILKNICAFCVLLCAFCGGSLLEENIQIRRLVMRKSERNAEQKTRRKLIKKA